MSYQKKLRDWKAANVYCYRLNILGSKEWRLPTIKELSSLIDPTQSNPSLPICAPLDDVESAYYWVASTNDKWSAPAYDDAPTNMELYAISDDGVSPSAMAVYLDGGGYNYLDKSEEHCVWCVQGKIDPYAKR